MKELGVEDLIAYARKPATQEGQLSGETSQTATDEYKRQIGGVILAELLERVMNDKTPQGDVRKYINLHNRVERLFRDEEIPGLTDNILAIRERMGDLALNTLPERSVDDEIKLGANPLKYLYSIFDQDCIEKLDLRRKDAEELAKLILSIHTFKEPNRATVDHGKNLQLYFEGYSTDSMTQLLGVRHSALRTARTRIKDRIIKTHGTAIKIIRRDDGMLEIPVEPN
jgi:hypothetical protein